MIKKKRVTKFISLVFVLLLLISSSAFALESVAYSTRYEGDRAVFYFIDEDPGFYHVLGSRSWRNNNPGNLKGASDKIGSDYGGFAIFASYSDGYNAMKRLLFTTSRYADCNIRTAIETYAPHKDNNDVDAYVSSIKYDTGMTQDTKLQSMSSSQRTDLLKAMIKYEGFKSGKYVHTGIMRL